MTKPTQQHNGYGLWTGDDLKRLQKVVHGPRNTRPKSNPSFIGIFFRPALRLIGLG